MSCTTTRSLSTSPASLNKDNTLRGGAANQSRLLPIGGRLRDVGQGLRHPKEYPALLYEIIASLQRPGT